MALVAVSIQCSLHYGDCGDGFWIVKYHNNFWSAWCSRNTESPSALLEAMRQTCALEFTSKRILWRFFVSKVRWKQPSIWYALSCAGAPASLSLVMELIYVLFYLETIDTKNCLFILGRALWLRHPSYIWYNTVTIQTKESRAILDLWLPLDYNERLD